jgi:hypothetical protein
MEEQVSITAKAVRIFCSRSGSCRRMMLCLLATKAEHWLAHQLNAYLRDPNKYRARHPQPATTSVQGSLGGTITYTPHSITMRLDRPTTPRNTRALTLLTDQLNTNPNIPGDPRPITTYDQHSTVLAPLPDV